MLMAPCPFLAEKIWIINESVSYFNQSDARTKVTRIALKIVPYRDGLDILRDLVLNGMTSVQRLAHKFSISSLC